MSKRKRLPPDRCPICSGECVPARDNYGNVYLGCARCRIVTIEEAIARAGVR